MDPIEIHRLKATAICVISGALAAEAEKRLTRSFEEWSQAEIKVVWAAARDFAQQHGLRTPTLVDVIRGEALACGHNDYRAKWSQYVIETIFAY